jgi:hypothetical protein
MREKETHYRGGNNRQSRLADIPSFRRMDEEIKRFHPGPDFSKKSN